MNGHTRTLQTTELRNSPACLVPGSSHPMEWSRESLGSGLGGAAVPWISHVLGARFGWQAALRALGLLILALALPAAAALPRGQQAT